MNKVYSEKEIMLWAEEYCKTMSILKVARKFNVSAGCISKRLKNIGINLCHLHKYNFDKNFFSKGTPASFYWAGFLAADGCIKYRGRSSVVLCLGVARKDERHLEKFKKAIKFTGPIKRENNFNEKYNKINKSSRISITITGTKCIKDLYRFNIVPRKSLIYTFPLWLKSHKYVNHFIRGYFDGDGSVSSKLPSPSDIMRGRKIKKLMINFRGTVKFLNSYQKILMTNCNIKIKHRVIDNRSNVGRLAYSGNKIVLRIANFMYGGASKKIFLERKYNKIYDGFFDRLPENFNHKPVKGICLTSGCEYKFGSIKEAAHILGIKAQNISSCLSGRKPYLCGFVWDYGDKI